MVQDIERLLGCADTSLAFLQALSEADLTTLHGAIENALMGAREQAHSEGNHLNQVLRLLSSPDRSVNAQGLSILHALDSEELWEQVTEGCRTEKQTFVSDRHKATYGLFQAWCENPYAQHVPNQTIEVWELCKLSPETAPEERGALLAPLRHLPALTLRASAGVIANRLEALAPLTNVTTLVLRQLEPLDATDLTVLSELPNLQTLQLVGISTPDLPFLRTMPALTQLFINGARLTNLQGLQHCPRLQDLQMWVHQLHALDGIESCSQLKNLLIERRQDGNGHLSSLAPLAHCMALEHLTLGRQALRNLHGLENKPRLQSVVLKKSHHNFTGLAALRGCTQLRTLHITSNYGYKSNHTPSHSDAFQDLRGLEDCTELTELIINDRPPITDLSVLSGCTRLTNLQLNGTKVTTLDALTPCRALQTLRVSVSHSLQDIGGIRGCTDMRTLHINECPTNIVDELQGMTQLSCVEVSFRFLKNDRHPAQVQPGFDIAPPSPYLRDRASVAEMQERMGLLIALQAQDRATVEAQVGLTELNLSGSTHLTNPALLQLLTNLTWLDLRACTGLPVQSWQALYDTPQKVAAFQATLARQYPL